MPGGALAAGNGGLIALDLGNVGTSNGFQFLDLWMLEGAYKRRGFS